MDPLKSSLETINQELEDAMNRLNESNRRVDELLSEFNAGEPDSTGQTDDQGNAEVSPLDAPDDSREDITEL